MKYFFIALTSLFMTFNCEAQQLMKNVTLEDAQKIKDNEQNFINKPLKTLFKEIKPTIKVVSGYPGNLETAGHFTFTFVEYKEHDELRKKQKFPLSIIVFVKEPFEWNTKERHDKEILWNKEDEKKYGDLTILRIDILDATP